MAFSVGLNDLEEDECTFIRSKFTVKRKKDLYNDNPEKVECFAVNKEEGKVYLPLGSWDDFYKEFPHFEEDYPEANVRFKRKLYTLKSDPRKIRDQDVVAKEAISKLEERHTCLLSCFTGFGKTSIAIYLACWSRMKTVFMVFHETLQKQWFDVIKECTNARVQLVKSSKEELDPDADFYIIGLIRASKMPRKKFKDIGMIVLDEIHYAIAKGMSESILKFRPCYFLGASATPDRNNDGLHKILFFNFGPKNEFIIREETDKKFKVIKFKTKFRPTREPAYVKGRVSDKWSTILNSIAYNPDRQKVIVELARNHPDEKIIILGDRTQELKAIHAILKNDPGGAELLIQKGKKKAEDFRVLVTSIRKSGIGFDDPTRTMMILIRDVKDVRQYEGRLRTDNCTIYDIVDDYGPFEKHWELRKKWYISKGAEIIEPPKKSSNHPLFLKQGRES